MIYLFFDGARYKNACHQKNLFNSILNRPDIKIENIIRLIYYAPSGLKIRE